MITKISDFKGRFKIPNATDTAPNSDLLGNSTSLYDFISDYEEECLILILGYTLYKELLTNLNEGEPNGILTGADAKWDELVNGKDNYRGLRTLLVSYIFFYYLENDESQYSGVGIQRERGKGSRNFTARPKATKAWRTFYKLTSGEKIQPEVIIRSLVGGSSGVGIIYTDPTEKLQPLYGFLTENAITYPDAVMSQIGNMNYYGI